MLCGEEDKGVRVLEGGGGGGGGKGGVGRKRAGKEQERRKSYAPTGSASFVRLCSRL